MIVNKPNSRYYVKWVHQQCGDDNLMTIISPNQNSSTISVKCKTDCLIMNDEKEVVLSGSAYCSVKDTFSKEKGRKVSLARALSNIPRSERKIFWDQYRMLSNKLKW